MSRVLTPLKGALQCHVLPPSLCELWRTGWAWFFTLTAFPATLSQFRATKLTSRVAVRTPFRPVKPYEHTTPLAWQAAGANGRNGFRAARVVLSALATGKVRDIRVNPFQPPILRHSVTPILPAYCPVSWRMGIIGRCFGALPPDWINCSFALAPW